MLTAAQKAKVAFLLCYPGTILTTTSTNYNSVFVDRVTNIDEYTEAEVISLIAKIEAIDLKVESSPTKSNVKRIDDIELDTTMSDRLIQKEANRLRKRLSSLLDIPNRCSSGGAGMCGVCQ